MPTNNTYGRPCAAFDTAIDGQCGRDTHTTIVMGLVTGPATHEDKVVGEQWEVYVEVPVCDDHEILLGAIEEEVEPLVGVKASAIEHDGYVCLPTFRMSVDR